MSKGNKPSKNDKANMKPKQVERPAPVHENVFSVLKDHKL